MKLKYLSQYLQLTYCGLGIGGNLLCVVVFLRKRMRSLPYGSLLLGLAVFDLLVLVKGLLSGLQVVGVIDYTFNSTSFTFFRWLCDLGSKYFVVAISLDRYLAVCHPLQSLKWKYKRSTVLTIGVVVFAIGVSLGSVLYSEYVSYDMLIYKNVILAFLPVVLVSLFSGGMAYGIWKYNKSKDVLGVQRKDVSATKLLLAVTGFFTLCCFVEALRRILQFCGHYDNNPGYDFYDYVISHLSDHAYLINSTANCIIYGVLSTRFRQEVRQMFCCAIDKRRSNLNSSTTKSSSTFTMTSVFSAAK